MRQTQPSSIAAGRGRFCSGDCQAVWQSRKLVGKNNVHWKNALITRACECCKKPYSFYASQSAGPNRRFCSTPCRSIGTSGEKSHMWRGGKSFEPYPLTFNKAFKRKIRARDNQTCAICGNPGRSVHHINYVKDDTTPDNCTTLCRPCHGKTGANRDRWQVVLTQVMKDREKNSNE